MPCQFFARGYCRRGASCRFSHVIRRTRAAAGGAGGGVTVGGDSRLRVRVVIVDSETGDARPHLLVRSANLIPDTSEVAAAAAEPVAAATLSAAARAGAAAAEATATAERAAAADAAGGSDSDGEAEGWAAALGVGVAEARAMREESRLVERALLRRR